jgi:Ni,Fe-hydrogenase I large subunit
MATPLFDGAAPTSSAADAPRASTSPAEVAIARVLAAEREARAAVADCARQAERDIQTARERARAIQARAAERVARAQAMAERELAQLRALDTAQHQALARVGSSAHDDAQQRARAVERLADELTRAVLPAAPVHDLPASLAAPR